MRVLSLHIYPVKGCQGVDTDTLHLEERGPRGDRRWMLVDETGRFVSQREDGRLALLRCFPADQGIRFSGGPDVARSDMLETLSVMIWRDEVRARLAPEAVSGWISDRVGRKVRLVWMPDDARRRIDPAYGQSGDIVSFADGYPILVTSTASLKELNRRLDPAVGMRRFRPNIVVEGSEPFAEDRWRRIRVGQTTIDLVKDCARCAVVDTDPATGKRDARVQRALAEFRLNGNALLFGRNGVARDRGVVAVGDAVEVLEEGPAWTEPRAEEG